MDASEDVAVRSKRATFGGVATNALSFAFLGALLAQVTHEVTHGVVALVLGARWDALNLFAAAHSGEVSDVGEATIAGSAAIVNIVIGLASAAVLIGGSMLRRPRLRLLLLYFGTYSLALGFGYLMFDPLLYAPGAAGDWAKVIDVLGGGWAVRLPILAVGVAGIVWLFFWVPRSVLRLDERMTEQSSRVRMSAVLLLVPYLVVSALFTVLALVGHPLGIEGAVLVAFQYWLGSFPLGWGFFMASYWLQVPTPLPGGQGLPSRVSLIWSGVAVLALLVAALVLLPTIGELP